MSKKLIVNADDFGRTHPISDGILKAHRDGIVTSATAMMNMPGAAHDLHRALNEAPEMGLGVHLVFTTGRQLLPPEWAPSLIDEHGHFLTQDVILNDATRINPGELLAELKAQVSSFKNVAGRAPDHIDCHHFVHIHPHLFAVYHDLALELGLPMRVPFPLREADLSDPMRMPSVASSVPEPVVQMVAQTNWARLAEKPVRAPDHFVPSFYADNVSVDYLLRVLDWLPDGVSELMTHPGYSDETLTHESGYNTKREEEIAALTDPRVRQRIAERGIELTTFASLGL